MAKEPTTGPRGVLTERRPGRPISEDLRGRAVAAVLEGGMTAAAAARRFGLVDTTIRRWVARFRERGHLRDDPKTGRPSRIEPERERILRILAVRPTITILGLRDALAAEGAVFGATTVHRFLNRHGMERYRRLARLRARRKRWTER